MIEVTLGTNTERKKVIVPSDTVLRDLLENNDVEYNIGTLHIDGCPIETGDMDKTLSELGLREKCFIISIIKADNA